jgi:hypothetical protein
LQARERERVDLLSKDKVGPARLLLVSYLRNKSCEGTMSFPILLKK